MIVIDASRCSGCSRCEVNCSFFHSGKISRSGARIKLVKIESIGIDLPVVCQHCRERYCNRCPESAIEIGPYGQIIVSPTLCTVCGTCEKLCPIGAIEIYNEIPHVCDLCGGNPKCVNECPMGAITFEKETTEIKSLEKYKKPAKGLKPEEKRLQYVIDSTKELRKQWVEHRS